MDHRFVYDYLSSSHIGKWFNWAIYYPSIVYNVLTKSAWWNEIKPGIILGRVPLPHHPEVLHCIGVKQVIALTQPWETWINEDKWDAFGINILSIPTEDNTPVSITDLNKAVDTIYKTIEKQGKVYIHCKAGIGRAASVVTAYLMSFNDTLSISEAEGIIRNERPEVCMTSGQRQGLLNWKAQYTRKRRRNSY